MMKVDRQRYVVVAATLVFVLVITLPYVYAALSSDQEKIFGGFLLNPIDGNSYLAKMYLGWQGRWTFELPYTAQEAPGVFLFVFYLFLGHIARVFQLSLILVFHLARIVAGLLLVAALYRFVVRKMNPAEIRVWLFVLLLFGTGSGWLGLFWGQITANLWVAEAYPVISSYANPHFPLGLALLVALIFQEPTRSWRTILAAFMLSFALALILPFGVVILGVVLGFDAVVTLMQARTIGASKTQLAYLAAVAIGSLPILFYDLAITWSQPLIAGWNEQNLTPSPPFWDLILGFSPAILLAALACFLLSRVNDRPVRLSILWLVAGLVLMYLPFGLQRRMISGLFIPVAILAIFWIGKRLNSTRWNLAGSLLILLSVPTTIVVIIIGFVGVSQRAPQIYLWRSEVAAFNWIRANTRQGVTILASPDTGLLIPAYTGRQVLYGHPFETVDAEKMEQLVITLIEELSLGDESKIPDNVEYLFVGPREDLYWNPNAEVSYPIAYQNEGVKIYSISPSAQTPRFDPNHHSYQDRLLTFGK